MSEIKNINTRQEVIAQQAQKAIARQNAIWSNKEGAITGDLTTSDNQNNKNNPQDSLYISKEAQTLFEEMERIREDNEKSAEAAERQGKCMMIAMRIAAGDNVPEKDIKFLLKYNPGMYAKALQMRIPKTDPEEYDTVLDEKDKEDLEKCESGTMNMELPEGVRVTQGINISGSLHISD